MFRTLEQFGWTPNAFLAMDGTLRLYAMAYTWQSLREAADANKMIEEELAKWRR